VRLRLGCWDVEGMEFEKVHNPGVLEIICMTILENRWDVIAMINFSSDHVLDRLVTELNFPTLHKVKSWRQTYQTTPKFDCLTFHCDETDSHYGYLFAVPSIAVERCVAGRVNLKIGAVNMVIQYGSQERADDGATTDENVVHIRRQSVHSNLASGNLLQFGHYSVHGGGRLSRFAGRTGVVEEGLTHLAIPNGWTLGGRVTRSSPAWIQFLLNE